ncbi:MAG: TonB-dependent receptor [Saprospiraceae bacterium]
MNSKYLHIILFLLTLIPFRIWAQNEVQVPQTVTGIVLDAKTGDPIIGVTIQEASTDRGTITDVDGRFRMTLEKPDPVLIFRYTGYTPVEIKLEGRTELEVKMTEADFLIDEIVVVGYGIQKKSDLTGAVSTVKGKDLSRIATSNVEQALQGKVAGVYVSPSSGTPGAGAVIRIRGTGTLNNANPLYVIDGMITYDASLVNPEDIESVEVLKDASAAAIYGSRGANGVIIITTKKGIPRDRAYISGSTYYGTQQITKKVALLNGAEFASAYNDLRGQAFFPDPTVFGEGTDWQDQIYRMAPISNSTISANGGSDQYSYSFSGNYFSQDGIIKNSHYDRLTLRLNAEYKLTPSIRLGHNLSHSTIREDAAPDVVGSAYRMPPIYAPRDSTGDFSDPTFFGLAVANPAADLFYKSNQHFSGSRLFGNLYVDINLFKDFTFRSNLGIDRQKKNSRFFEPKFDVSASQRNLNDRLSVGIDNGNEWIWEQTLTFNHTWNDHHLTVLAGYTAEERKYESLGGSRENFPGTAEELLFLSAGNDTTQMNYQSAGDEALTSNIYRINYTYKNRYLLTLSWRTDRSSRFTKANRTGNFPSGSIGWNIGEEPFMKNFTWLDRCKVRGSFGILGNQNASSPSTGAVTSGLYGVFGPDESLNQGATLVSLANANLKWETSRQTDIGVEMGILDGSIELEVDWYNRLTYDIIAAVPIPDYVGSQDDPIVNTAKVDNTGLDITATYRKSGKLSYNVGVILSPVSNKVIKLAEGRNEIFSAFLQGEPATHTIVGLPIGAFYGYKVAGIFQSQEEVDQFPKFGGEKAGDVRYEDTNGDGVLNGDDRVYLGSPIPKISYSMTAGLEWNGIDFNADVVGASGNKVFNAKETFRFATYNWEAHVVDRWTPQNHSLTEPRITNGGNNYRVSDRFLEDGSFLRLRSVTLGYTLPKAILSKANISKLRFYITGTNLWTKQNYSGYSPEFANGSNSYEVGLDFGGYPVSKAIQGGVEIQF